MTDNNPVMQRSVVLITILLVFNTILTSQQNDWENPRVFGINKIPGRTTSVSYASVDKALSCDPEKFPRVLSLNGTWKFSFAENPSSVPQNIWSEDVIKKLLSNSNIEVVKAYYTEFSNQSVLANVLQYAEQPMKGNLGILRILL